MVLQYDNSVGNMISIVFAARLWRAQTQTTR